MTTIIKIPPYARMLLLRLLSKSFTEASLELVLHGKYVERFAKVENLLAAVEGDGPQEIRPEEKTAIALLKTAAQHKAEGKSFDEVRFQSKI